MNLNHVQLAGRLTRDPEIKYTQGGTAIADLSLAVSRFWKNDQGENQEDTTFVDITAFGKIAELVSKNLRKGSPIFIEGRLKLEQWEKDGKKHSRLKVVAESMQFIGPKPQTAQPEPPQPSAALVEQRARNAGAQSPRPTRDPDLDADADDVPY
jgi:single-strand DNA-binding protein